MRYAALLFAGSLLVGCGAGADTPTADDSAFELPADQVIFGGRQTLTTDGVRRSEVEADTVLTFEQSRRHEFRQVKVNFFEDNGQNAGTLTATSAEYDIPSGLFIARGNVVLVTPSPNGGERQLQTEELFFDVPNDRIWSDREFTLLEGGQTTSGTTFRSDSQFRTWEVTGARTEGSTEGGIRF